MVSGNFNGDYALFSEKARIVQVNNWWHLETWWGAHGTVQARARCMAYDQR
jgi:hypothetical protein